MSFRLHTDKIAEIMKALIVSYFPLFILLSILFIYVGSKEALAGNMPDRGSWGSGKFLLVETPDNKKPSDYLVVEKPNGRKSLIKLEKQTNNEEAGRNEIGNKYFYK